MNIVNLKQIIVSVLGGLAGWLVATFAPAFPLMSVMVLFCIFDAWTAYRLSVRVFRAHPEKAKDKHPRFSSYLFSKVITQTIPVRLGLILLAFMVDTFVAVHVELNLAYIVTGAICFEQAWSILENMASCEPDHRLWRILKKVLIDKTERHLGVDLDEEEE